MYTHKIGIHNISVSPKPFTNIHFQKFLIPFIFNGFKPSSNRSRTEKKTLNFVHLSIKLKFYQGLNKRSGYTDEEKKPLYIQRTN